MKFKKVIDEYLVYIEHELLFSPHTIGAYRRDLAKFSSFLRDRGLASFTDAKYIDLLCYMKELESSGYANISVIRNINAARSLFRFLINEDIIEEHVILDLPIPKAGETLPNVLSRDEIERLMVQPDQSKETGLRTLAIMRVMYESGLRVAEVCDLQASEIEGEFIRVNGKGGKQRLVPIGDRVGEEPPGPSSPHTTGHTDPYHGGS